MFARLLKIGLLAALFCVLGSNPADACGRRYTVCCATPIYYPCEPCHPCWCWQPNETPLIPPPAHPVPHGTVPHKLTLHNGSHLQSFAIVYIRHHDGVYREYEKHLVLSHDITLNQHYYVGDHLYIETWTRVSPAERWHCHCRHFLTLTEPTGHFDVIRCAYTHP